MIMINPRHNSRGFSLAEVVVSVAIVSMLAVTVGTFHRDVFYVNTMAQSSLNAQFDARHVVKTMVAELRKASPSSLGSYPILLASSTALTFYSDLDGNGVKEQVRYFMSGKSLKKGVIVPTGSPLVYNSGNEVVNTLVSDVVSSSTLPMFQYYSSAYDGTTSALVQPVTASSVRLIKINVIIDRDPGRAPSQIVTTSQVTLRNLKDNL